MDREQRCASNRGSSRPAWASTRLGLLGAAIAVAVGMICTSSSARAQDAPFGCKVLLCAAASSPPWSGMPYCVPVMQQLFSQIAKGGGWPACPEAGTSGGQVGYQPYQDCAAGSVAVSIPAGQSTYAADPNGSARAASQPYQDYQARLVSYNQSLGGQNGSVSAPPTLDTTARGQNPKPYYVELNTGRSPTRFYFHLSTP